MDKFKKNDIVKEIGKDRTMSVVKYLFSKDDFVRAFYHKPIKGERVVVCEWLTDAGTQTDVFEEDQLEFAPR